MSTAATIRIGYGILSNQMNIVFSSGRRAREKVDTSRLACVTETWEMKIIDSFFHALPFSSL